MKLKSKYSSKYVVSANDKMKILVANKQRIFYSSLKSNGMILSLIKCHISRKK